MEDFVLTFTAAVLIAILRHCYDMHQTQKEAAPTEVDAA